MIIGKFYQAADVETDQQRSILILEVDSMNKALNILNEGFLYNGFSHRNLLKFYGCYLHEAALLGDIGDFDFEKDEDEGNLQSPTPLNLPSESGVTY